ncbi:MAG: non-canonical purine NTP pyrophosphatase [Chlamydiales bacterium]|nr:non-canonical purine NTP pyrophosphatase [Chlamydiales bacterium]
MQIEYVTGNSGKFLEAQAVLDHWTLEQVNLDIVEVQGTQQEIIIAKAKSALEVLKRPLIVDDVGLFCNALNGLPGPYAKDFLEKLEEDGLSNLIHRYDDHRCHYICAVAFVKPNGEPQVFEGRIDGRIVAPRGTLLHGHRSFNTIFEPEGMNQTLGEMTIEDMAKFAGRSIALKKLRTYLEQHDS